MYFFLSVFEFVYPGLADLLARTSQSPKLSLLISTQMARLALASLESLNAVIATTASTIHREENENTNQINDESGSKNKMNPGRNSDHDLNLRKSLDRKIMGETEVTVRRTGEDRGNGTRTGEEKGNGTRTGEEKGNGTRTGEERGNGTRTGEEGGNGTRTGIRDSSSICLEYVDKVVECLCSTYVTTVYRARHFPPSPPLPLPLSPLIPAAVPDSVPLPAVGYSSSSSSISAVVRKIQSK